jgi:hypothetical protein
MSLFSQQRVGLSTIFDVHMDFSCVYCAHKVIKFTIFFKKITHILSILLHRCIKFEVQIQYSLSITKREKYGRFTSYVNMYVIMVI